MPLAYAERFAELGHNSTGPDWAQLTTVGERQRPRPTRRVGRPLFGWRLRRLAIRRAFGAAPSRAPAYPRSSRRAEAPAKLARPARIAAR